MVISVSHLTDQVEITGGGHARILSAARGPAFPPAGPPTPVAASDSCTLTPLRGYDDPFQFHGLLILAGNGRSRENGAASMRNACGSSTEGDNRGRQSIFRAEEHAGNTRAALRGKLRIDLFFQS